MFIRSLPRRLKLIVATPIAVLVALAVWPIGGSYGPREWFDFFKNEW